MVIKVNMARWAGPVAQSPRLAPVSASRAARSGRATSQPAGQVAEAVLARGVAVSTLERYYAGPVTRNGLVLGYGGAALPDVVRGCEVLAQILDGAA